MQTVGDGCGGAQRGNGLGFLPYANCCHYGDRRDQFRELVGCGTLAEGFATDAGTGLHFEGTELVAAISDRAKAGAYHLARRQDGSLTETPLDVVRLKRG